MAGQMGNKRKTVRNLEVSPPVLLLVLSGSEAKGPAEIDPSQIGRRHVSSCYGQGSKLMKGAPGHTAPLLLCPHAKMGL